MGKPAVLAIDIVAGTTSGISELQDAEREVRDLTGDLEKLAGKAQEADRKMSGIGLNAARNIDEVGGRAGKTATGLNDLGGAFELLNLGGISQEMGIVSVAMDAAAGAADLWTVATDLLNVEQIKNAAISVGNTVKYYAMVAAENAVSLATKGWAVAQEALNIIMSLNPIGLVIIAIIALIAIIVLAWQHSETFREIVTGAWNAILGAVKGAWSWISGTFWPGIQLALQAIGSYFTTLRDTAASVWLAIVGAVRNAWDTLRGLIDNIIGKIQSLIDKFLSVAGKIPGLGNLLRTVNPTGAPQFAPVTLSQLVHLSNARVDVDAAVNGVLTSQTVRRNEGAAPNVTIYLDGQRVKGIVKKVVDDTINQQGRALASRGWA